MPQKKGRRGKPRQNNVRRSKRGGISGKAEGSSRILPAIAPPSQLRGQSVVTAAVISGAAPAVIKRWNPNAAYTPETGGGSGATPGYADLAALYGYTRVISYRYEVVICNLEAFDVVAYVINSNNDPTTSNNSTIASNPRSQKYMLSAKGGQDRYTFKGKFTIDNIVGSPAPKYDDLYSALINANPADLTWLGVGIQSATGANVTNGCGVMVSLWQDVIWYDNLLQIFRTATSEEEYTSYHSRRMNIQHLQMTGRQKELVVRSTREREVENKRVAFDKYAVVMKHGVPMTTEAKYNHIQVGHIPFVVVY